MSVTKYYTTFLAFCFIGNLFAYQVECNFFGLPNDTVHFMQYQGKTLHRLNTAISDSTGFFAFKGAEELPPGLYKLSSPGKFDFNIFLTEPNEPLVFISYYPDVLNNLTITGNNDVGGYIKFLKQYRVLHEKQLKQRKNILKYFNNPDSLKVMRTKYYDLQNEMDSLYQFYIHKNAENVLSDYLTWHKRLQHPWFKPNDFEGMPLKMETAPFPLKKMYYTPLIEVYLEDFIKASNTLSSKQQVRLIDHLLQPVDKNHQVYKFVLQYLYNHYNNLEDPIAEAVFYNLARQYYLVHAPYWTDDAFIEQLNELVALKNNPVLGEDFPVKPFGNILQVCNTASRKNTLLVLIDNDCDKCISQLFELDEKSAAGDGAKVIIVDLGKKLQGQRISTINADWAYINLEGDRQQFTKNWPISRLPYFYLINNATCKLLSKGNSVKDLYHVLGQQNHVEK